MLRNIQLCFCTVLICASFVVGDEAGNSTSVTSTVPPTTAASASSPAPTTTTLPSKSNIPDTLLDFILAMMKKYGEVKAAEAFQSLDQLPLGLIMKILLVEVDKTLAADIVAMQRYAQASDKALIQMIGRIVAGDKNVPKEIFAMDQKLMKFPWWMRIRQRMFNNLEKYVAAYSLVPVAARAALNGAKSSRVVEPQVPEVQQSDLAAAVAASATEPTIIRAPSPPSTSTTAAVRSPVPSRLSLLTPIQQQQVLETLALARAANAFNSGGQTQSQQFQTQATPFNPLLYV